MKIIVERELLLQRLLSVQIISSKPLLAILSNILITAENETLSLIGTDLDMSIKTRLDAQVEEAGAIVIQAKVLINILRELFSEKVEINVSENNLITISTHEAVFKIFGLSKDEFPTFPEVVEETSIVLPGEFFKEIVKKTIFGVSTDETKYILNGVCFVMGESELKSVTIDGHRLVYLRCHLPEGISPIPLTVIIPPKALNELTTKILEPEDQLKIIIAHNQIAFETSHTLVVSKLIEGEFPEYEKAISQIHPRKLRGNKSLLLSACKRASIVTSEKTNYLKFSVSRDLLIITANTPNLGDVKEELDIAYTEDEEIEIAFNPKYIIDILKNIDEEEVEFAINDAATAAIVRPVVADVTEKEYLGLIMGMRF